MTVSVFDLFSVGIGPSSSHTVGPMRAANRFVTRVRESGVLANVHGVRVELFGSLGATGRGHGSPDAVLLGLEGHAPESVQPGSVQERLVEIRTEGTLRLGGTHPIPYVVERDLILHRRKTLSAHPNGMRFSATDASGAELCTVDYYSVGGGFVLDDSTSTIQPDDTQVPKPFTNASELLSHSVESGESISGVMHANELTRRSADAIHEQLLQLWRVMAECVANGRSNTGNLPGGMQVRRRAADLSAKLSPTDDPMEWVTLYALAVNEENAAGGRVVTAPTNGAAGIVPAVLHYYVRHTSAPTDEGIVRFLLTAGAIGALFKENASISGAEVGCQGEVGSACSMAAAGLTEVLGGSPTQVENAAEIGLEHNLGLTCDPIGGLVQIPCIERNAVASVKAVTAARMALRGDGNHYVSLDKAIKTMRDTGRDMKTKYKETARGGLAVNVIEC
ncbi:L-serine ammonia-lyase [Allosaccharopolyspora coralli]|uniref:L-serine dehydratase n=1 Tax=Allosaccharopolyspora coralli TaxID=2665642 RepID=A0A5Q3Q796_9PSEU|nr:L-serine ammonia-lyase [Allosaccharopolyspora coralli]QGK70488.1 L-serine ammonia-lyase [Allosaccharopolyspora coralli]